MSLTEKREGGGVAEGDIMTQVRKLEVWKNNMAEPTPLGKDICACVCLCDHPRTGGHVIFILDPFNTG